MTNKLYNLIKLTLIYSLIYYMLQNRIHLIKKTKQFINKVIASLYISTQITSTLGMISMSHDSVLQAVVISHILFLNIILIS
jgi:hypothetical protein